MVAGGFESGIGFAQTPIPVATPDSGTIAFDFLGISVGILANPQRIGVLEGRGDLEFGLICGYPVVGGDTSWTGEASGSRLGDVAPGGNELLEMGDGENPDLEQLASLRPDLIVMRAHGYRRDWYGIEQLSRIAPVLPVEVNRNA